VEVEWTRSGREQELQEIEWRPCKEDAAAAGSGQVGGIFAQNEMGPGENRTRGGQRTGDKQPSGVAMAGGRWLHGGALLAAASEDQGSRADASEKRAQAKFRSASGRAKRPVGLDLGCALGQILFSYDGKQDFFLHHGPKLHFDKDFHSWAQPIMLPSFALYFIRL
jgi:hypothetical protein